MLGKSREDRLVVGVTTIEGCQLGVDPNSKRVLKEGVGVLRLLWEPLVQTLPLIGNKILLSHFTLAPYSLAGTMDGDSTTPPLANDVPALLPSASTSGSPTDFLKGVVGKRVVVRLTSGVDYRGVLSFIPSPKDQRLNSFIQACCLASMDT